MSQLRKYIRLLNNRKRMGVSLVEEVLFGTSKAPTQECAVERKRLCDQFRLWLAEFGAKNPENLWRYLVDSHRGYTLGHDGNSLMMQFVGEVQALRDEELAIIKEKASV